MNGRRFPVVAIWFLVTAWAPVRMLAPSLMAQLAFDVSMVLMGGIMALTASARAEQSSMPEVWRAYAAAGAAWSFSFAVTGAYQATQGTLAPIPSLVDLGRLVFLAGIGSTLARLHPARHEWRDMLDSAIVAVSLALLASLTRVGQLFASGDLPPGAGTVLAFYSLIHIVLLSMALMVTLKIPGPARVPLLMLVGGLTFIAASEGAALALRFERAAQRGALLEAMRLIGISLLALVPLVPQRMQRVRVSEPGLPTVLLPVVLALAGVVLVVRDSLLRTSWTELQAAIGAVLLGLMLARMTATGFVDLRLRRERAAAIDDLRELEAQRTMMLRAISHEIQNPLTPVRLHAQMVAKQAPHLGASLQVIQRNIEQVSRLAKDLNVIAKSDTEGFDLAMERVEMRSLAQRIVEAERPGAQRRGVSLVLLADGPAYVMADPDRMLQVLGNLVRNALKFTPSGGRVAIRVEVGQRVHVAVTDTGRGLEPDEARRLFTAFTQVHDRSRQPIDDRGSGLGLYIARRLIESHDGIIGVRSEGHGHGSTFWFELPLAPEKTS